MNQIDLLLLLAMIQQPLPPQKKRQPAWEQLPHTGMDLTRAQCSRDYINIWQKSGDQLAYRYFLRRVHGWQTVLNVIANDHGKPNVY